MGDTQELIERLLWLDRTETGLNTTAFKDAADTIASLQRREEKLREALTWLSKFRGDTPGDANSIVRTMARFARQALEDTDSGPADAPNGGKA